jgi:hypothetical protein
MSIEALVYGRLTTYSGITAIASTRTYPMRLPQTPTLPAVTYQKISNSEQKGTSTLKDSRYQLNCWASTYAEAHSLAAQIKAAFEEWHDLDQTPGVLMARMVGETDTEDDDTKTYRVILDVMLTTTGD